MNKYWKKFKMFWRELGNILTNIACPFLAILVAISEIFGLPANFIQSIKKAEYWCWNACGTKDKIDEIVDAIDQVVTPEGEE